MPKQNECLPDTTGLLVVGSQRLWQRIEGLHRFMLDGVPGLREGHGHGLPTLTKKLSVTDTHWPREKSARPQWSLTGYKHTSGQAIHPGVGGQHEMNRTLYSLPVWKGYNAQEPGVVFLKGTHPFYPDQHRFCWFSASAWSQNIHNTHFNEHLPCPRSYS